jgi:hypothetical protein
MIIGRLPARDLLELTKDLPHRTVGVYADEVPARAEVLDRGSVSSW